LFEFQGIADGAEVGAVGFGDGFLGTFGETCGGEDGRGDAFAVGDGLAEAALGVDDNSLFGAEGSPAGGGVVFEFHAAKVGRDQLVESELIVGEVEEGGIGGGSVAEGGEDFPPVGFEAFGCEGVVGREKLASVGFGPADDGPGDAVGEESVDEADFDKVEEAEGEFAFFGRRDLGFEYGRGLMEGAGRAEGVAANPAANARGRDAGKAGGFGDGVDADSQEIVCCDWHRGP